MLRSAEVARVAGVSVRTLRHYHRIGLLREPDRSQNGYRSYRQEDVARLLRIRLLVDAGVPLARVGPLLDGDASASTELQSIEDDLTERIDTLTAQRALARELRADADAGFFSAMPPSLLRHVRGVDIEVPATWTAFDEDLALVLHRAVEPDERAALEGLYAEVSSPARAARLHALVVRFQHLSNTASAQDVEAMVDDAISFNIDSRVARPPRLSRVQVRAAVAMIDRGPFTGPQRDALRRLLRESPVMRRGRA